MHHRVASRYLSSAFIPDKWFKAKKAELSAILKRPLKDSVNYWSFLLSDHVSAFFYHFRREFAEQIALPKATDSIRDRVESANVYLSALTDRLKKVAALAEQINFENPEDCLRWFAVSEIHEKMASQAKTYGDLYKWSWFVDEAALNRLVKRAMKAASPEEVDSLTSDSSYRLKYEFLARVKFKEGAVKLLKRTKLEWDPTKWVGQIYEMLQANYSEYALDAIDSYQEFDLHGIKVVVEDKTVDEGLLKKYIVYLKKAYALLKSKGFGKAWYGNVFIQPEGHGGVNPNTGGGVGGEFLIRPNTIIIYSRPSSFITELMVHELGHRYWFRNMSSSQRAKFSDLVKTHKVPRPRDAIKVRMFKDRDVAEPKRRIEEAQKSGEKALERAQKLDLSEEKSKAQVSLSLWNVGLDIVDAIGSLEVDKDLGAEVDNLKDDVYKVKKRLKERSEDITLIGKPKDLQEWLNDVEGLLSELVSSALIYLDFASLKHNEAAQEKIDKDPATKAWLESYENNPNPVLPVSSYGKSNVDEAFAEVFSHYVMDAPGMSRDQLESFRSVVSSHNLDQRVLARWLETLRAR